MKIKTPIEFQTFNDGICGIFWLENIAGTGNKPKEIIKIKLSNVPYERRKVGVTRYYTAKQAGVKADNMLRIPYCTEVSTQDICVVNGVQNGIKQVQHNYDTLPPSTDLTLERLEADYDFAGVP